MLMKIYRTISILALMLAASLTGCTQVDECSDTLDAMHCSNDATALLMCLNGKWVSSPCTVSEICGYTSEGPKCLVTDMTAPCTPGTTLCAANMVQKCNDAGKWSYEICNGTCQNGVCTTSSTPSEPQNPQNPQNPAPNLTGIIKFQCSADKKSIETVYHDGTITTQTCLQAVGFDAECNEYSNGLAGCTLPESCNDIFSQNGTCAAENRRYCDTQYIIPKPAIENCAAQGKTCSMIHGKAQCRTACDTPSALSCTVIDEIEYITLCANDGTTSSTHTAETVCISNNESATCQDGEIVKTTCDANTQCIADLGKCAEICTADKTGDIKCTETGELVMCSAVSTGYAYISLGMRHCDGNTRLSCKKDDAGIYTKTETDCTHYTDNNGNIVSGTCVTELQYYPDMDVCYFDPTSDGRCNALKDAGICEGSILKYCDETSDNAYTVNCAANQTKSMCSVFAGYADCRKPCSQAGKAVCSTVEEMTMVKLCAPDDATGITTEIEGQAICLGNELYTCDENGNTQITNCAANGGICQTNACVYPACTSAPVCLADDAILACQITSDGQVLGASLETTWCLPNGTCHSCSNGQLK